MVSHTPFNGSKACTLPRRDIIAICAFLGRKQAEPKSEFDRFDHAEGVLQQLAAAARMQ